MQNKVLILNQSYEPIGITTSERAFVYCWLDKADMVEMSPEPLHSPNASWERPSVIRMKARHRHHPRTNRIVELSRKNVFRRDNYTCVYCGERGGDDLTLDHVIPKSRGGENRWENLVTSCHPCNNKKDNMTPDEAGMSLSHKPKRPSHLMLMIRDSGILDSWKPYLYIL